MSERAIKLTIEYDGSAFYGWQSGARAVGGRPGRSVQDTIQEAIHALTGESQQLTGAGRTDAGVSARGQVAVFRTNSSIPADRFAPALTASLPPDVTILHSEEVPLSFNPRKGAKLKLYRYRIVNRKMRPALERATLTHISVPLDHAAMVIAAANLVGTHDFTSFAAREATSVKNPVRTITRLDVSRSDDVITIDVEGPAFLMHMVRTIAGSLIEVGRLKHPPTWIADVLAARDRCLAGPTAPACGLTLMWIRYDTPG